MSASLNTPTIGLGQLIQERSFFVPRHQRDYSWTIDFVNHFLEDVERAQHDGNEEYFFGLMVFTQQTGSQRLNVIDGQQRLATTIMLLSAIRNWMAGYPTLSTPTHQIEERYIGFADLGSDVLQAKVILNTTNNDLFKKLIIDRVPRVEVEKADKVRGKGDRNKRLLEAALRTIEFVEAKAASFKDELAARDYFIKLIKFFDENVRVVSLIPGGDEDAYTIFETLNDRSLALAPLDLVKNLLFSRAENFQRGSLPAMEARWNEMMTVLERSKVDAFLRVYWASRYGLVEGTKLFAAFKGKFTSAEDAFNASNELRDVADEYVALDDPSDPLWAAYSPMVRKRIEAIRIIGATQLYPLMLSAIEKFSPPEMEKLLHLVEVIAVRYQLVARGRPGRMESLGSQVARKIHGGEVTTTAQVKAELGEIYPDDKAFKQDFLTKTEKDAKKAAYMLRALELQSRRAAGLEHPEELQPGDVTIEHIMGRSLTPGLQAYLGPDAARHDEYRDRLGNLCLLGKANSKLGDKLFPEKVSAYSTSDIRTTNSLSKYTDWRMKEIDQRQGHLAEFAVVAWRY
ncbi:DUF262 domain-containing protein [Devosia sp.]|uniref:DUF262 domain-containing protein n=1 Tax=Devosia sp. TaxID=1871048 RepID=UPI002EDC3BBB